MVWCKTLLLVAKQDKMVPWVILSDGDGNKTKGFKGECSTVKGNKLIVGGIGKEWITKTGEILNYDPMWIKEISCEGAVTHINWKNFYIRVKESQGISFPGYMIHEGDYPKYYGQRHTAGQLEGYFGELQLWLNMVGWLLNRV